MSAAIYAWRAGFCVAELHTVNLARESSEHFQSPAVRTLTLF